MVAAKVEPSQPPVQEEVQNPELEGVRAWPQEPRRRHDLAERGCNCRVGTTEERSSRRPAAVLEPRGPDRVDAAGRLQPAAPPDRGVPGLAAPLDGPQPQGPGPHHTLAPEPNRCGAAPDPILRRPDRLDRRFHRAEDAGLRRMERAQAQGIKETPGLAEAAHRGGCRGVHCGGRTHSEQPGRRLHTPCSSRHIEVPIRRFTADGAYDHRSVYDQLSAAGTENVVIVIPPRRSAVSAGPRTAHGRSVTRLLRGFARSGDESGRRSRATDSRRALKTASSDTSPCSEAD